MAAPTNHVYLDDGTGTYPIDITSMVRLPDGLTVSGYGRSDESPTAESASFTFTLDNWDGSFSSGVGFGLGGFGSGFFGGLVPIVPGTGVRWSLTSGATTVNRFTGKVSSMNLAWPTGGQEFSTVQVTAVDTLADLSRKKLRSMLEQEILRLAPASYYTLGEAVGSTSAGDTSGNGAAPLTAAGTGTASVFGATVSGIVEPLTGVQFAAGQWLQAGTGNSVAGSTAGGLTAIFSTTTVPTGSCSIAYANGWLLGIDTSGRIIGYGPGIGPYTGAVVTDGRTHYVAVSGNGFSGGQLVVDGVVVANGVGSAPGSVYDLTLIGQGPGIAGGTTFTGTVSHVAYFSSSALSLTSPTAIYNSAFGAAEATDVRLTRLASYAGKTATTTSGSGQLVGGQATTGSSMFDAMQAVATAEAGVFYADGSGVLRLQGRAYRAAKTTATLALAAEEPGADTVVPYDTQQLINEATATRTDGAAQVYIDPTATSATGPGEFPVSIDLIVADDASALGAAQWVVNKHKTPAPRIAQLTLNPLAPASATGAQILSLAIGDRVSLVMPSQNWATAGDYTIEGWTETVTESSWSITYNVLPWSLFQCAIYNSTSSVYDTAVYGQ